jgi:hypothetical protein
MAGPFLNSITLHVWAALIWNKIRKYGNNTSSSIREVFFYEEFVFA